MKPIAFLQVASNHKFCLTALAVAIIGVISATHAFAQTNEAAPRFRNRSNTNDPIARIRDEGLNRSEVMQTLSYLTDVIGPRLTGSPNLRRANDWTREKLQTWGLSNAHLEQWGPFGYGWSLERFSAEVVDPQYIPIKAYPSAWSPGLDKPITANVVFIDATNTTQLQKYKGKLKGAIVLPSPVREVPSRNDPLPRRLDVTTLLELANASIPIPFNPSNGFGGFRGFGGGRFGGTNGPGEFFRGGTNAFARFGGTNSPFGRRRGGVWARFIPFFNEEGVAAILAPSTIGDAGTIFVASASVPLSEGETNSSPTDFPRPGNTSRPSAYSTNAPTIPPQITVAVEDYNRLVRIAQFGEEMKAKIDLKVQFHKDDLMVCNTIAEIPGGDLKDEIVMVGAHLDSWHSGTGATDNGAGCAAAMEAVRIIKALDLKPRRTIRVALWTGEEQGLLGSKAYVTQHFGRFVTNTTEVASSTRSPRDEGEGDGRPNRRARSNRSDSGRKVAKEEEYDKLSAYFNLDNGAGKIRGIYMQGNEAVRPYFRKWLEPFRDLGAETITPSNTGSTDHISFTTIGLPGFQFLQDPLDYNTRTHHSNEDVYDRVPPDDLKQASVIMAAFVYNAAMLDEKLPRKPLEP